MYFPYLRGRQYELLALRELARDDLIGKFVVPIVEPVKKITSTFSGTLKLFGQKKLPLALVLNPSVGDLVDDNDMDLLSSITDPIIPTLIKGKGVETATKKLVNNNFCNSNILAILTNRDYLETYNEIFADIQPKYTLFPDERQIRRAVRENKVMFEDKFSKQDKNADYLNQEDEFFPTITFFLKMKVLWVLATILSLATSIEKADLHHML
jgi:hypothetical protein